MYLPDVALHNLACLTKKGMLLIQEQFRLFLCERNYCYTVVRKFFDRKYFIDKKIQGKIFSLMHDFLKIFLT